MNKDILQKQIEFLFNLALKKCGNFSDAEDLIQETLCCYYQYNKPVENPMAWLKTVMNRKYYDRLRREYKLPTISIEVVPELSELSYESTDVTDRPDEEEIRREVAYLSEKYREVIVSHYFYGEKVNDIAARLNVPKGTVLSRLSSGREQMRKGFENMSAYENQSYRSECLDISNYGSQGIHDEPFSLVNGDLLKQNILIAAYSKPIAAEEIAKSLGVPTAYIEVYVNNLVKAELMHKSGTKVFTDFMIITPDDISNALEPQIKFTKDNYPLLLEPVIDFFNRIDSLIWFGRLSEFHKKKLKYFFLLHLFSKAIYTAVKKLIPDTEIFPQRPDGGRWIAQGMRLPQNVCYDDFKFSRYCYGGERRSIYENILGAKTIDLHIYDTQPDLNKYNKGSFGVRDQDLPLLLYTILRHIPFNQTGIDVSLVKSVPYLCECGILKQENEIPFVDIPVISPEEYNSIETICSEIMLKMVELLLPKLELLLPEIEYGVPKHLETRIAKFRRYDCYAVPMAFMEESIIKGDLFLAEAAPPMVLVIDDFNKN